MARATFWPWCQELSFCCHLLWVAIKHFFNDTFSLPLWRKIQSEIQGDNWLCTSNATVVCLFQNMKVMFLLKKRTSTEQLTTCQYLEDGCLEEVKYSWYSTLSWSSWSSSWVLCFGYQQEQKRKCKSSYFKLWNCCYLEIEMAS